MTYVHFWKEMIFLTPVWIILTVSAIQRYKDYLLSKKSLSHQAAVDKLRNFYCGIDKWSSPGVDNIFVENKLENTLYGEITYQGMQALANKLKLSPRDVFYDLGCGMGKLVLYIYLAKSIKKSVGIEMVGQRYQVAQLALEALTAEGFLDAKRELAFIHNNIRKENFSDATAIFMSSLCFPADLMEELKQKCIKLKKGLRIASLIPLPKHQYLYLKEISCLSMTWSNTSRIYYYELV